MKFNASLSSIVQLFYGFYFFVRSIRLKENVDRFTGIVIATSIYWLKYFTEFDSNSIWTCVIESV